MHFRRRKRTQRIPLPSQLQQTLEDLRSIASDLRATQVRMAEQVDRFKTEPEEQGAR